MISLDGAALIATVYPVGILILVFEARALLGWIGRNFLKKDWMRMVCGLAIGTVVFFAMSATALCVIAVSSGEALSGSLAATVFMAGFALYAVVCCGIGASISLALTNQS